ncbi:MAG: cytochrome c3 family protein, partial [Rubritepida sp.]|nr:cytochrome c3 family protein [Rubritepida sp.]
MAPTLKGRLRRAAGALLLGLAAALPFAAGAWFARPALPVAAERAQPGFVGSATCATCHATEHAAWAASDHAHAMAAASPRSVLGDFSGVAVEDGPHRARFDLQAGRFLVETEGAAFTVTETFGRDPLQQYLVLFPDGRRQALPWAWDARPAAEGGQRWYHLMRDDAAPPGDPLHWTGRDQNWNFMCAACHSTGLQRGYDAVADRYDTAWTEIAVGCESCHGRGAAHVAWARSGAPPGVANRGLELRLADRSGGAWRFVPGDARGIARWEGPPREAARAEAESCAPCHARARPILADPPPGARFLDSHAPTLLAPGLYHADGQIDGEVFEWGSFAQSKMQRAGVTCSDCHDVHRGQRRAEGDALCAQCHLPARFAARAHHGHPEESAGARCVACHMPAVTYMGVDRRRDHAFSVPRPAVSAAVGAPDACTACHTRETQGWAAAQLAAWHGPPRGGPHPALAIHAGRQGAPGADAALRAVVLEPGNPAILRATAVSLLAGRDQRATGEAVGAALLDAEPLLRAAALRALSVLPPQNRP